MQNLIDLGKVAEKVLGLIDKDAELSLDYVAKRVNAALNDCPEDPTIKGVASLLNKRLHKDAFGKITKDELYEMYNDFYTTANNQFRDQLGDLLPEHPVNDYTGFAEKIRDPDESVKPIELDVSDEYNNVFEKQTTLSSMDQIDKAAAKAIPDLRNYDKNIAKVGCDMVEIIFKMAGCNVEAKDILGDDKSMIYCVAVDSPYKKHYLFVPASIENGDVKWPEHFIAGDNLRKISKEDITEYINGMDNPGTDYNRLFAKTSIVDDSLEVPKPLKVLVASLEENLIEIGSSFDREVVAQGRTVVQKELESLGCRVKEVKIASEHSDGIIYSAAVSTPDGNIKLDVPVEFNDDRVIIPNTFACGDNFKNLTAGNIKDTINKGTEGNVIYEFSMDVENMNFGELRDTMIYSVASKSYAKAEEILNYVGHKYGVERYKHMFNDYLSAMKAISKTASLDKCSGCAFFEKSGKYHASNYCNKLAMDADKVVKTASGCYRYRYAVDKESAITNSGSNIKLGDE